MFQKIRLIHPEGIDKAVQSFKCGDIEYQYIPSEYFSAPHFETKPVGEYMAPKKFPDCCEFHRTVHASAISLINDFPNCCDGHRNLIGKPWFNKKDYLDVPAKLINTMAHTEYHIINRINIPEWYRDLTNYFDYCISSFGQLPDGYGSPVGLNIYLVNLKSYIKHVKNFPADKKKKLIAYLEEGPKGQDKQSLSELNILLTKYSKWLKLFPFDLSLFSHLKEKFQTQIPILKGESVENPYTGFFKAKLKTQQEFIEFLISVTEKVLAEVNSLALYEAKPKTNFDKLAIEVLNENRRLELNEFKEHYTDERKHYIRVIKKWFIGESRYLISLRSLISIENQHHPNTDCESNSKTASDKITDLRNKENKIYKGLPMEVVIDHLSVLTTQNSKNGKPFFTDAQFHTFLEKGFLGKLGLPKQRINVQRGEKGFIIKRFYQLFEIAVSQYGDLNQKFKYIKVFSDCISNWPKDTIEAFFRPNKTKREW